MAGIRPLRHALALFGWRVRGFRLGRLYKELMEREYWTDQQWREYQTDLLRRFVRHCYENVPVYRTRFDQCSLSPQDIRSLDDLVKIPPLSKDDVRKWQEQMLATNYPRTSMYPVHTTGSTGAPLTFFGHRQRSEHIVAGLWRIYSRCGWQPGEKVASIWGFNAAANARASWKRWLRDSVSGTLHFNAFDANDREFEEWLRVLKKNKPSVLVCYASSGSRFARWLLDRQETLPCIKGVYTTSEKLFEQQARLLEQAFECKVFDLYGCGEAIHIACTCEQGSMHINPDMVVVENGEPNEQGTRPLIITGLRNWAMPFLRYVNGDCGLLVQGACDCGRQSPLMDLQIARVADVFRFPDGKEYPSLYFILRLYAKGFDGVELFQFHQDQPDHIRLLIVKNSRFTDQTHSKLGGVKEEIEAHIDHQARVDVEYVDGIEQTSSGKHLYARSQVAPQPE